MREKEDRMEQWSQEKARPEEQTSRKEARTHREPERARLQDASHALQAALDGVSLLDMPPSRLEELAGWLGNQNMAALLESQGGSVALTRFVSPGEEPGTVPYAIPEVTPPLLLTAQGLTNEETAGRAFDPTGLSF